MDDPVFPKLPKSIVECCKDPISEIWAKSDENWAFYGHLPGLPHTRFEPGTTKSAKSNVESCKDPKSEIWAKSDEN